MRRSKVKSLKVKDRTRTFDFGLAIGNWLLTTDHWPSLNGAAHDDSAVAGLQGEQIASVPDSPSAY